MLLPLRVLSERALPRRSNTTFYAVLATAAALIVIRSLVWILFEQSGFDSDQAVAGLMSKHWCLEFLDRARNPANAAP
jgi:hypothetical protein